MKYIFLLILLLPCLLNAVTITTVITDSMQLADWEDSTDVNLVTAQKTQIAELRGAGFTGHFTFKGAYANSEYYRKLTVTDSNRTGGAGQRFTISTASGEHAIEVRERYFVVDGIKVTAGIADYGIYLASANTDSSCRGCVVKNNEIYSCHTGIFHWEDSGNNAGSVFLYNNFIWNCAVNGIRVWLNDSTAYLYNNTIADCGRGIYYDYQDTGDLIASNNICLNNVTGDFVADETYSGSSRANLTSDASAPGGFAMVNKDGNTVITDTTMAGFNGHLKNGSPAIDTGHDLSDVFTIDIDNETISGDWARGADFNSAYNRTLTKIYVKPAGSSAWAGLDSVFNCLDTAIWISEGRYDTNSHTFPIIPKSNTYVYGGFKGWETTKEQRGPRWRFMFRTVFDACQDTGAFESNTDENTSFTLDGLKIVKGWKRTNKGAGVYCTGSGHPIYATIRNCWFDSCSVCEHGYPDGPGGNEAGAQGAAINVDNSSSDGGEVIIEYCVVARCTSICGALEIMNDATPTTTIRNCIVINNRSYGYEIRTDELANDGHRIYNCIGIGNDNARYDPEWSEDFWAWASDSTITYNCFAGGGAWPDSSGVGKWTGPSSTIIFADTVGTVGFFDSTNVNLFFRGNTNCNPEWGAFPLKSIEKIHNYRTKAF